MESLPNHIVNKHRRTHFERIEKFISQRYYTDTNLYGRLCKDKCQPESIYHKVGEEWEKVALGFSFGPTFSTHKFEISFVIPDQWKNSDHDVRLLWDSGCESLLYLNKEDCVFGFSTCEDDGRLKMYKLDQAFHRKTLQGENGNNRYKFIVEPCCLREMGEGKNGMIKPPDMKKMFQINQCHLMIVDTQAETCYYDLQVLWQLAKSLPEHDERSIGAITCANDVINALVREDFSEAGYAKAKKLSDGFFCKNKCGQERHTIHMMGHCHIDTAWLWPYHVTKGKCARSWSSAINLMEKHPDFTFVCSQAQQLAWVKQEYPRLFKKIQKFAAEGRFIPVGGTWVEMDGILPSGESMMRQFFYGQRFFTREFGARCREFWLPDTFGYSPVLPQVMKEFGIEFFLTQKLSWNLVNKFPHSTFYWEGLDGTSCLTHFPPGDSYGMEMKAEELVRTYENHKDKIRSDESAFLFGYGDGGGGPTEAMLKRQERLARVRGFPFDVVSSTPKRLFEAIAARSRDLCKWSGELFLELHNATYTSEADIKKSNRRCEILLHDLELLATINHLRSRESGDKYPHEGVDELWKLLLLNQFHDVLPGSSIQLVVRDAMEIYGKIEKRCREMIKNLLKKITRNKSAIFNTLQWPRKQVCRSKDGKLVLLSAQPFAFAEESIKVDEKDAVKWKQLPNDVIQIKNFHVTCEIDSEGHVISLKKTRGEVVSGECIRRGEHANEFVTFDDVPLYWDAWDVMDYHLETRKVESEVVDKLSVTEASPLRVTCKFSKKIGSCSLLQQEIVLDAFSQVVKFHTKVDWKESHKFLKVEFPLNIHSRRASFDVQFGHLERPTHQNTSWEMVKFEVWSHKWMDLHQHGLGVAVLNDSKYGCSAFDHLLRLSLLRSPKAPNAEADMGTHTFTYAMMPHTKSLQEAGIIRESYHLNYPLRKYDWDEGLSDQINENVPLSTSFIQVSTDAVVLETVKMSHEHESCCLLRFYESFGSLVQDVTVSFDSFTISSVHRCNGLEETSADNEELDQQTWLSTDLKSFTIPEIKPFQIFSVLVNIDHFILD